MGGPGGSPRCVGQPLLRGAPLVLGEAEGKGMPGSCCADGVQRGNGVLSAFPLPQKTQTFPLSPVWPSSPVPLAEWFAHVTWKWAAMRGKRWWCWKGVCVYMCVCVGGVGGGWCLLHHQPGTRIHCHAKKKGEKKGGRGGGGGKNKIMKSKHGMIARPGKIQPFHAPKWCPPRRGDKAGVQGNQHPNLFWNDAVPLGQSKEFLQAAAPTSGRGHWI